MILLSILLSFFFVQILFELFRQLFDFRNKLSFSLNLIDFFKLLTFFLLYGKFKVDDLFIGEKLKLLFSFITLFKLLLKYLSFILLIKL